MKNNFKNWDKIIHKQVSSKGGKVKSRAKSRAARLRFRKRIQEHVNGWKYDEMVNGIIEVLKYYKKPLVINC
jgi:hypothetical protein